MKRVVFIASHLGADSNALGQVLGNNPRVQFFQTNSIYDGQESIERLTSLPHKLDNVAAIWLDELLYNHYFSHKCLYKFARFIYLIRTPKPTLNEIVREKWQADYMERYYTFRLRRIYEMARKTPGAILLTHEDFVSGKGFGCMEEYLNLKVPLVLNESVLKKVRSHNPLVSSDNIERSERSYERYLYLMRQMPLRYV